MAFAEPREVREWAAKARWQDGYVRALFEHGQKDVLKTHIYSSGFSANDEIELINLGDADLIWFYISRYELDDATQCALIEKAIFPLVDFYIKRCSIGASAQIKLIWRGDADLMRSFSGCRVLSTWAEKALIETKDEQLITAYIAFRRLSEDGEELLVRLLNKKLVQIYLGSHGKFISSHAEIYAKEHQLL